MHSFFPPATTEQLQLSDTTIPYEIVRSARRKRSFALSIDSDDKLQITVPVRTKLAAIRLVLQQHARWIAKRIELIRQARLLMPQPSYGNGESVSYLGHAYRLNIAHAAEKNASCHLTPHRFEINLPQANLSETDQREETRLELILWFKKRARTKLQKRIDYWAHKLHLPYRQMIVVSPERRWGSCNAQNVIRLNWRLLMAPMPLIDYVIIHELCHTVHKNHGAAFWRLVGRALPDYRERRKFLRKIGPQCVL